jgi:pectate lyase
MKIIIAGIGIAVVVFVGGLSIGSTSEVITNNVEIEVTPEWAEDQDAVEAAQEVIQRKAWEIELEDKQEARGVLDAEIEQLEKDLGVY